jgi:hypothetical protein
MHVTAGASTLEERCEIGQKPGRGAGHYCSVARVAKSDTMEGGNPVWGGTGWRPPHGSRVYEVSRSHNCRLRRMGRHRTP